MSFPGDIVRAWRQVRANRTSSSVEQGLSAEPAQSPEPQAVLAPQPAPEPQPEVLPEPQPLPEAQPVAAPHIDMRALRPPLPTPGGHDRTTILEAIRTVRIDDEPPGSVSQYAQNDCERFIRTVDLVPHGDGRIMEIGSNPYFTSLLLRWFRPGYALSSTNFFGPEDGEAVQTVRVQGLNGGPEEHIFTYKNLNIERARFPFEDGSMDGVLFCEVIEHLLMDPLHALREIWRVLKPGGFLVLTTPNVARLINVIRMIEGGSPGDPYSGHGPYGRHNREYNVAELTALGTFAGFRLDTLFTSDVHGPEVPDLQTSPELAALIQHRDQHLGEYLFTRWTKAQDPRSGRPRWLFASYPESEMATD